MKLRIVKFILIGCLIFQLGCALTLKRKNQSVMASTTAEMKKMGVNSKIKAAKKSAVLSHDATVITAYYLDVANAIIRKDMISHTRLSKKQKKKLVVGKILERDIQVVPLPLNLEKILSSLPLHLIRVQVGEHVILMNVKSRQILEVIKI